MAHASLLASNRTSGARRACHDVLEDGADCGLHNNAAKQRRRPLALGRSKHLFVGMLRGSRRASIIYTLAGAAELNTRDPQACLRVGLGRTAGLAPRNLRPDAA